MTHPKPTVVAIVAVVVLVLLVIPARRVTVERRDRLRGLRVPSFSFERLPA